MKILIISHNPCSTYQNMGKTFVSIFHQMKKEELSQLYIYPSVPNVDTCSSYYRITDKDVLASFYRFRVKGKRVFPNESDCSMFENQSDEKHYRNRKNKRPIRMLLRDLMWKLSHWFNKGLKEWLEVQKPTHIFVAPGTAKFLYDIALKISKRYNIPIITYICDDYYFVEKANGFLKRIQQKKLQKRIEKLVKNTAHIVTICKELEMFYSKKFGVNVTTIMTGSSYEINNTIKVTKTPKIITYMGNIRCNRFNSLVDVGNVLDEINKEKKTSYSLKIYSAEKDESILSKFENIKSIEFCGFVAGNDFNRVFKSAEILLHTEAFDKKSIDLVKHSVSTKIADSLGSGIPLFAYGPKDVSSMKHLINNNCAIISTDKNELKGALERLFIDEEQLIEKAQNAINVARTFHDSKKASDTLRSIMYNI